MAAAARRKPQTDPVPYYAGASPMLLAETPADPTERSKPTRGKEEDWQTLYQHCESRFQAMVTWRLAHWTTWGQIARYQAPWRYYAFVTANMYNNGLRSDYAIVDRTATIAGEICAAGLMAGLTDPDSRWLKLGPAIPNIELDQAGQNYYEDLTERLNYLYDHSNFYDAQNQHYSDLTFFGTAPIIDYESKENILYCKNLCAGEYLIANGFDNSSEVLYDETRMTVSQIVEGFGPDNCPEDLLNMWKQKGGALEYESVVGHCIEPNFPIAGASGQNDGVVPGGFTWREVYWIRGRKDIRPLSISGFKECPFAVSRWDTQGNDPYGRGVGEKMLGDTIQLQLETRQKAESIEKVNRPPMGADVALMNQPNSTNPGKITYMNTGNGGEKKFFPLFEIKPDIPAISADIQLVQERLRETAYNKAFATITNLRSQMKGQVTATEIDALKEEALTQLGPVIGRIHGTLRQRVKRHLSIMDRFGLLPKKPQSLKGVPLKIDLISMLTQARRASQTAAIARTVQFAGTMVAAWPEARFKINPEEAIQQFNDGVGATDKIMRTDKETQKMMAAENQQKQVAQATALSAQAAQAGAALGKTSLAPGNALSALVGGQQ